MDCQNFAGIVGCKFVAFYFAALQCKMTHYFARQISRARVTHDLSPRNNNDSTELNICERNVTTKERLTFNLMGF